MTAPMPAALRWLGHACVQIDLAGVRVLTDPALTPRLAHLRRHHVVDRATIEQPDLILISHIHLDHLHLPSLRMFDRAVPLLVPAGAERLVRRAGFSHVHAMRAGDTHDVGPMTIETVPAVHSNRRGPHTRLMAEAVGYLVRAAGMTVYFPGDTDLFEEMATWGRVDVALLPIWGWGSRLGEGHLDPTTAARATEMLRPELVLPVHWGTYSPMGMRRPRWLDEPVERFRAELAAVGASDVLHVLAPGTSLVLPESLNASRGPGEAGNSSSGPVELGP